MAKKIIFLDLDGTILDVSERIYRVYSDILKKYKKKALSKRNYIKLKKQKKPIEEILKKTGAQDISSIYKKEWLENIEKKKYLRLDTLSTSKKRALIDLKKRNNLILITSRKKRKLLYDQIKIKGISDVFKKVIIVPEDWREKVKLLKKEIKNKDCLLVSDTEGYISAGKNIGIKTVAVYDGVRTKDFLKKFSPNILIKNITGLNQCNFLI